MNLFGVDMWGSRLCGKIWLVTGDNFMLQILVEIETILNI